VKHHRPEILQAFDHLECKRSIKRLNTDPGPGLTYKRGRPKTYFTITEVGLKELLADANIPAIRFWELVCGFCLNNDELVTLEKIDEFYHIVIVRYLRYNRGFSSKLDSFQEMCNKWLEQNVSKSEVTVAQKVIEVLALNRKIILKELLEKTCELESEVNRVLPPQLPRSKPFFGFTQDTAPQLLEKTAESKLESHGDENDSDSEYHKPEYTDFIIQNIITCRKNKDGNLTYELSLFGVILTLVLIRYNDLGRLGRGLYFRDYSLQQYFDNIASKYEEKLPLIFGNWSQLKRILKVFAVYNFDSVLDKEKRSNNTDSPSEIVGGNKELSEAIREITSYNKLLMEAFASEGLKALKEYYQGIFFKSPHILMRPELEKIYPLCYKLADVMTELHPTAVVFPVWNVINFKSPHISSILKEMEKALADEITAVYYINLCNGFSNLAIDDSVKLLDLSPIDCLSTFLEQDKEGSIRKWFTKCMKDLEAFQEDILKITKAKTRQMGLE
jgi:hypothetical protein